MQPISATEPCLHAGVARWIRPWRRVRPRPPARGRARAKIND